ncbi:MAG: NIPSNAP family protein [Bacteroidota bacterium]|nr:NIPSNAP family protein [Bacteroidota bacterium]
MKRNFALILLCFFACSFSVPQVFHSKETAAAKQYIELRIYHFNTGQQLLRVDSFLKQALVPALHEAGIEKVGVFTPVDIDTATDKKMYVLIPHKTLKEFEELPLKLEKNKMYMEAGAAYMNTVYNQPAYARFETILLQAFEGVPEIKAPQLTGEKANRVYELRSYESSTEKLHQNKVQMFTKGGETGLFQRLGFNPIFYGHVLSGSRMPNLMYMTSFENKTARDENWKAFSSDPFWKTLSAKPEYQNNVSKIDIVFLTPATYSDL